MYGRSFPASATNCTIALFKSVPGATSVDVNFICGCCWTVTESVVSSTQIVDVPDDVDLYVAVA